MISGFEAILSQLNPRTVSKCRKDFKVDELGLEILSIAFPAALALAADPIASLVDSAFIGHLGSAELAAVGVSISVFNLVSKLLNVPLLNITTSFVAEEQALASYEDNISFGITPSDRGFDGTSVIQEPPGESKKPFPAVSASLALAAGIGIAEAITLSTGSGSLMNIMGISVDSPMRLPAEQFLALRAFGAPPIVIALAAQGTFRGFMDTKTPLYATVTGNLLNAILDPFLIFFFGLGIGGAAISTVISEYFIAFVLLRELNSKVLLVSPNIDGRRIIQYLKSGGLLIGRTVAVLFTMTLATSMAARQGPVFMAGHQICMEVWLAVSLLTDALALSGQALLASGYSQRNFKRAQDVIYRVLQIGLLTGVTLAVILFFGFETFSRSFTTDTAVLDITRTGVLFVAGSQPITAVAFVLDGLYYGVSDFAYAAYSMVFVGLISSLFLYLAAPVYGLPGVWMGLFLFMALRVAAGFWRLGTRSGPWKMVWSESEQENN
ncbi:Detoxification 44 protein [Thalictrum thalictroides]|uniref:Protein DETOXIFICATION n=1 Tax=Thalictrum thalictroides TaxID=46969 RepID=A0A7J6W9Y8_THATH|nr:Detoxification 44 protein [Thalictrum thalictroides]